MPYKDPQKRRFHYALHRDEIVAQRRKYCDEHRAEINRRGREWYAKHREERLEYNSLNREGKAAWYAKNRDDQRAKSNERYIAIRREVLRHYGGKCAYCGDSNPDHLSIDHINNDGAEHRRMGFRSTKLYRWLRDNNYPDGFQLLCFTHNFEKGHYGRMTPAEFK